mmetsp:Transcript_7910/g.15335  ORF Transcript_7910/g.15335 Transcript_7910/m.15335 type:complete len:203 (-) Transcript_7910:533-1141(-)
MTSHERPQDAERDRDEHPYQKEFDNDQERNRVDGTVNETDQIQKAENCHRNRRQQQDGDPHDGLPQGVLASRTSRRSSSGPIHFKILARSVSRHDTGESITDNDRVQDFPAFFVDFSVQGTQDGKENDRECQHHQLPSGTHESTKGHQIGRCAKDITVYLLPSSVFAVFSLEGLAFVVHGATFPFFHVGNNSVPSIILAKGS